MRGATKRIACCSLCGAEAFECLARWEEAEHMKFPERAYLSGQIKSAGAPKDGVMRITFLLASGEIADFTFCEECAGTLTDADYGELWALAIRSWSEELIGKRPDWFVSQMDNAILAEVGRRSWLEVIHG